MGGSVGVGVSIVVVSATVVVSSVGDEGRPLYSSLFLWVGVGFLRGILSPLIHVSAAWSLSRGARCLRRCR